jgi:hypothetical protein
MTTLNWYQTDSEENYSTYNVGKLNYQKDEIQYKFNSMDYRCDEFTETSELPILFMGCSYTEGVGLPINEVWAHHLHKKIIEVSNKNIPFWSIAKGGTSIDYASRRFFELGHTLKPKYAFYLLSGISRREYCFETEKVSVWFPKSTRFYKKSDSFTLMTNIFADAEFAIHQAYRSAMLLEATAKLSDTKIIIFDLPMDGIADDRKIKLFEKFENIEYVPLPDKDKRTTVEIVPNHIKNRPLRARDTEHPGAQWQYNLYDWIWQYIQQKGIDKKLIE